MKRCIMVVVLVTLLVLGGCSVGTDEIVTKGSDYEELILIAKSVKLPILHYSNKTGTQYSWSKYQVRFRGYSYETGEKLYTITIWELAPVSFWDKGKGESRDTKYNLEIGYPVGIGKIEYSEYVFTLDRIRSMAGGKNAEWMVAY